VKWRLTDTAAQYSISGDFSFRPDALTNGCKWLTASAAE
jgi:hypothetical protein